MSLPRRVAVDARYVNDRYHGIGRYGFRLLEALTEEPARTGGESARDTVYVVYRGQALDSRFDWATLGSRSNVEVRPGPWPLYWPQEQFLWPLRLRQAEVDLFYSPYFVAPLLVSLPVVTTVHDLIFDRYPTYMPARWSRPYYRLLMKLGARRARRIVAVSQATAADLRRYYPAARDKMRVVLEAPDPIFWEPADPAQCELARRHFHLSQPFVLTVGVRRPHKNLARLVRAFAASASDTPHDLVLVGPPDERFPDEARLAAAASGLEDRVRFVGWVSEAELKALYALADLVALPSLVEGFGLPALEAMASGTPVLAANTSSLPEVIGDAGVLVDPYDEPSLAGALRELLADRERRLRLAAAGRRRAATFSWPRVAQGVRQVLEEAAS